MSFRAPASAVALLSLCVLAIRYSSHVPAVVPASAPPAQFSAERAMVHVREIAQRPHPSGSADHARVRAYIVDRIAELGLAPEIQETTGVGTRYAVAGRVRNIMVRMPGSRRSRHAVLLMAHYDGVPAGPAAGDDASGSAVLLETLSALRAGPPLANDVIVLFTDSEESGLLGAAAFAREHPWARDAGVILNFEARGTAGPSFMFETGSGNADVVGVLRGVPGARATSLSTAVYRTMPNDTDLSEMMVLDRPAMNFAFIGGVERYHTSEDDAAHLSAGSVQHHGNQALALARAFGNGSLPRPMTSDAVFFDFPVLGMVVYPVGFAVPIAFIALSLAVAAIVILRRRDAAALKDAALGAAGFVLSVAIASAIAGAVAALLYALHARFAGGGAPQWRGVYALAIVALCVALVAAVFAVSRRVAGARGLVLGAVIVCCLASLYASIAMPGVSFLFVWPALLAAAATLTELLARPSVAVVVRWIATGITLFLVVPTAYVMVCVALGLDVVGAALLAVLTGITLWLIAPHFAAPEGARSWRPAIAAFVAALALLATGVATVRSDEETPAGAAIVYAIDSDSLEAWMTGTATTPAARIWMQKALAAAGNQPRSEPPAWLTGGRPSARIASAPVASFPAPEAILTRDSSGTTGRVLTLRIRAGEGARSILLTAEAGVVLDARVDGRPVDRSRYRQRSQRWVLDYVAPPDSGFTLSLTIRTGADAHLGLMARHTGIPPLEGMTLPARPAGIIPIQAGDATHIYRRVVLSSRRVGT